MILLCQTAIQLHATGSNSGGKLGISVDPQHKAEISQFTKVVAFGYQQLKNISLGANHAVALDRDQIAYAWGSNSDYQLGTTESKLFTAPVQIQYFADNNIKIAQIAAGSHHTIAVASDNRTVYSFGSNMQGQLGRTTNSTKDAVPAAVNLKLQKRELISEIHASSSMNLLITNMNNVFIWGFCENRRCPGLNDSTTLKEATKVLSNYSVAKMYVGKSNVFFTTSKQGVFGFGDNRYGQLCTTRFFNDSTNEPQPVNVSNVEYISVGEYHTLLIQQGCVYGCGSNNRSQLGNAVNLSTATAVKLHSSKVKAVAATYSGSILVTDEDIFASGFEMNGELGINSSNKSTTYFTPISISFASDFQTVIANEDYSFLISKNDYVIDLSNKLSGSAIALIVVGTVSGIIIIILSVALVIQCAINRNAMHNAETQHLNTDSPNE